MDDQFKFCFKKLQLTTIMLHIHLQSSGEAQASSGTSRYIYTPSAQTAEEGGRTPLHVACQREGDYAVRIDATQIGGYSAQTLSPAVYKVSVGVFT